MSINYCTIGTTTVDSFCGNQRAKILARLIGIAHPPVVNPPTPQPGNGGIEFGSDFGGTPEYGYTNPWYDPYQGDTPNIEFEQPYITVKVSDLFGDEGTETLQAVPQMEFVTVTNLEFEAEDEDDVDITVNITGLEI